MKVLKQSRKGQLNRAKPSAQAVQQPPQDKGRVEGRVNFFTKTNMALPFLTLTAQCNRCESGALFHVE
jgi:hypothetical protein